MPGMSAWLLPLLGSLLVLGGCHTQRTLLVDSQPSGARLWVNGEEQARPTPVQVPFTWYGRFEVRAEKKGYRAFQGEIVVPSQLDGYPLVDLPLEVMVPHRRFRAVLPLEALPPNPSESDLAAIRARAEAFRDRTRREVVDPDVPRAARPSPAPPPAPPPARAPAPAR